jgi:hypothetical protein
VSLLPLDCFQQWRFRSQSKSICVHKPGIEGAVGVATSRKFSVEHRQASSHRAGYKRSSPSTSFPQHAAPEGQRF